MSGYAWKRVARESVAAWGTRAVSAMVCLGPVRGPSYFQDACRSAAVRDALEHAADFLLTCQFPSGAINDRVANPLATLTASRLSRQLRFQLEGGADIWHTTNAILALARVGRVNAAAERFVRSRISVAGELSYWNAYPSLCIETCSAAFAALPSESARLRQTIVRHALPGGRWATSMVPAPGGYDAYLAGPSVTAWALGCLGREHGKLVRAGRHYLGKTRGKDGLWHAHPAFYATTFYPTHLAIRFVTSRTVREEIVAATLARQRESGGWGFTTEGKPSALPTALAALTVLGSGIRTTALLRALKRAIGWLLLEQTRIGSFRLLPAPSVLFYAGDVYATSVAMMALGGAAKVL